MKHANNPNRPGRRKTRGLIQSINNGAFGNLMSKNPRVRQLARLLTPTAAEENELMQLRRKELDNQGYNGVGHATR